MQSAARIVFFAMKTEPAASAPDRGELGTQKASHLVPEYRRLRKGSDEHGMLVTSRQRCRRSSARATARAADYKSALHSRQAAAGGPVTAFRTHPVAKRPHLVYTPSR